MNTFKMTLAAALFFPFLSLAGFPCPPDSCNPFNGCTDGCNGGGNQQRICSDISHTSCQQKNMYDRCQYTYINLDGEQITANGSCNPNSVVNNQITCGCR